MNPRFDAAWEIHNFLVANKIPYAIIGGTALPRWGDPRFTRDVDLVVMTPLEGGMEKFVRALLEKFSSRLPDPIAFARRTRMVLIWASNQCEVDIALGIPGYEDEVIRRAVDYQLEPGKTVRVCSAEDLIIHKCVAGRPQDIIDIDGILIRQGNSLDVPYIRKWLRAFADVIEPDVFQRFENAWHAAHPAAPSRKRKPSQHGGRKK